MPISPPCLRVHNAFLAWDPGCGTSRLAPAAAAQLVSRAPHSTRPRSSARDDDSSGLERLQTPGHLLREGGVSVASSQSMARRATPQASRSNVDFVWPASRPRLTERDGDDEAAGSADVMGTRRLPSSSSTRPIAPRHRAGVPDGTSRRSRESRVGGSSFSTPGVVSSAGALSGYAHHWWDPWAYAHPPFSHTLRTVMRTSHRGSPSFVSPRKPPGKEEWEEETIRGDCWSYSYV